MARRFEMEEGGSRKLWEIAVESDTVAVRFAKLAGTDVAQPLIVLAASDDSRS